MNEPSKEPTLPSGEVQVQTLGEVLKLEAKLTELSSAVQTLSQTMAVHMKQNLEMMRSINEYIGSWFLLSHMAFNYLVYHISSL